MRYLLLRVLAGLLAWPQSVAAQTGEEAPTNTGLAIHAQRHLPPQLMLRTSYHLYLDVLDPVAWAPDWDWCHEPFDCPDSDAKSAQPQNEPALQIELDSSGVEMTPTAPPTAEESQPKKRLSRQARVAIGVTVSVVIVGVGVGMGVVMAKLNRSFQ
jgi:hypothetical protein